MFYSGAPASQALTLQLQYSGMNTGRDILPALASD
jgi:hypothetical protein